ncbi:MFS transporter [Candidatus Peregrinibacteria bacterium]|nr:MFS transporter [Candidatus Peregrinibacteria bacterium]
MLNVVTIFLSKGEGGVIGFDDESAGYVVAAFTSATTLLLLVSGAITDWLGIRKSLGIALIGRLVLSAAIGVFGFSPDFPGRGLLVAWLFFFMAPFVAMLQTAFQAATKDFTGKATQGAGFNFWYIFMNVGAAVGGVMVDVIRKGLGLSVTWVIMSGVVTSLLCLIALAFMIRTNDPVKVNEADTEARAADKKKPWEILLAVVRESAFWKLIVLITVTLGVRAVFAYMYLLMPKYWDRMIGNEAAIGTLNAINPILIVVGLVLITPMIKNWGTLSMLTYGAMVSAVSLFCLVIPWQWLSGSVATSCYIASVMCMVVLSVGEMFWSPRLNQYTAAIAPEGQAGTYLGLSMLPWFLAKTVVSIFSGHMLERWCPEFPKGEPIIGERIATGQIAFWDSPGAMWLFLGIAAAVGPMVVRVLWPWLKKGMRETNPTPQSA